jgi:hypothetical protein
MVGKNTISIWFFIGALLLSYGIIIFIANVYEAFVPTFGHTIVLRELNFGIWWGILLTIIGAVYFWTFRPWKNK